MKKLFIHSVSAFMFLLAPHMAQSQWQLQTTLDGKPTALRIEALDENIVWVCTGNGYTYVSTDGGQNWRQSTLVTSDENIFVIAAIDSMTAVVGGGDIFSNSGNAKLYRTTDGGQSWEVVYTAVGKLTFWNMIHFFDAQNGIAMSDPTGNDGPLFVIVKTADGGATWTPILNPPSLISGAAGWINAFQFYDDMNGWFGTAGHGWIFRTTDGGETWRGYPSGNTNGAIWSVDFVSPTTGVRACNSSPFLTRTTDGGQTWTPVDNLPVSDIAGQPAGTSASTQERNQIWIYGEATEASTPFIITSTDGGLTWQQQTLPPLGGESIASLSAAVFGDGDSVRVWATTINRTTYSSGGQILTYAGALGEPTTDVDERPTAGISDYRLEQNYPNPFNPSTQIFYTLPQASHVTLSIYNLQGQLVKTLVSGAMPAGRHSVIWNAKDERGHNVPSGIYLYKLKAGEFAQVNRMLFIK